MRKIAGLLAMSSLAAFANTGTVTAELSGDTFNVSFANHAHETNSLWVVYDGFDYGPGTNGWGHVERLGTVTPETNTWTYAAPAGWGETVKSIRFILSEVPYDYDYSLDFLRSKKKERICLADFDLYCSYRICAQFSFTGNAGTQAIFTSRDGGTSNADAPFFNLFLVNNLSQWRFDYNNKTGSGKSPPKPTPDVFYSVAASWDGLYVNGTAVNSKNTSAAYTADQTANGLQFLCGGFSATNMSANTGATSVTFYGAQIYDAPTGGNLIVNLVPMVKDGRGGVYDTVRNVYYYSDTGTDFDLSYGPSRVESVDPFFASALCKAAATGPELFTPASAVTVSESITNTYGGILDGTATLTLSGENDWGGAFTVSNGTLVAAFGQGLGASDCLQLVNENTVLGGTYGGYGGWNGRATATLGSGAGQIYVPNEGMPYLAYCAADGGELEVDIGGAGAEWSPVGNYRRLLLNGAAGAGTLRFKNPIVLRDEHLVARVGYGTAIFEESVSSELGMSKSMSCYDMDNAVLQGAGVLRGLDNRVLNFNIYGGAWTLDEGTTNTFYGCIEMKSSAPATLLATNATVRITGEDGNGGWLRVYGGKAAFAGGSLEAGGFHVGEDGKSQPSSDFRQPGLTLSGKVRLNGLNGKSYGSGTIYGGAASYALTIEEGADIEMYNLVFRRRQVIHKGGTLKLKGGYGILEMGRDGTARYVLYSGAELTAANVGQERQDGNGNTGTAEFIFRGGTLGTTSRSPENPVFFREFNSKSHIYISSEFGGEFRADHATSITNGMETASSSFGSTTWNYAAAYWLTAPAFKKTGAKALTLSGKNTYACATDVAEGTLKLAGGEFPGVLPTNGVVRVTGGTLDLGGNEQTVRGLVGTAGGVVNGKLVAKDGIYPGGAGTVGSFTCGATLDGTLHIDVDVSTGAADKLVASGVVDISSIDLELPESGDFPGTLQKVTLVEGTTAGAFRTVSGLPAGWEIFANAQKLQAPKAVGFTVIVR